MSEDIKTILSEKNLDKYNERYLDALESVTAPQVQAELAKQPGRFSLERLIILLSPAATDFLEQMARQAHDLTIRRFGKTVQLYAPLYVSNYCVNSCLYCGYNKNTAFERTRLTIEQALADAQIIASEGFRNILLVSGEDKDFVTTDYLCKLAEKLRGNFSSISMEIYPMTKPEYEKIFAAGIDGVTLYQETYDRDTYSHFHIAGPKKDYDMRLDTPDRFASAGTRRIGLGVLLGLADWRLDTLALAHHAAYLMKKYWRSQVSFSFPRIRPALNVAAHFEHLVSDTNLVQMMIALRLCFADAGIVLSTRESPSLRDNMVKLCVTQISAGSRTNPGGYSGHEDTTKQFEILDTRSPRKVAAMIASAGYEPVWKDWDAAFTPET